ncbi:hypothetical protein LV779_13980 [Streptomyces thinghirensis]|nr:hypothetical protein [Streptomyces thinghirensis]
MSSRRRRWHRGHPGYRHFSGKEISSSPPPRAGVLSAASRAQLSARPGTRPL